MSAREVRFVQDLPPPGGYPKINLERGLAPVRGPSGLQLFLGLGAMMAWGLYLTHKGWVGRKQEQREKHASEIALIPLLQAEEDQRTLRALKYQDEEEARIMKNVPGWKVGESVYYTRWMPPLLRKDTQKKLARVLFLSIMVAIWYAVVAHKARILVEQNNSRATNLGEISQRLIEKIHTSNAKKSFSYENFNFHYISDTNFVFLCVAEADVGIRIPFAFLGDIQNRFFTAFGQKPPMPNINYTDSFGRTMQDRMLYFSEDPSADKINRVKKEIDEVKVVMERNIEKVLDRGEKIEILVSKTEDLSYASFDFKKSATRVKRKMWWKSKAACVILSIVLVGE